MNRERFIRDRRADWGRFEQLLGTLQSLPERQWRAVQVSTANWRIMAHSRNPVAVRVGQGPDLGKRYMFG